MTRKFMQNFMFFMSHGGGEAPVNPSDLILEIDPSLEGETPSGTFRFNLVDLGLNSSIEIEWGDDSSDVITTLGQNELTHIYPDGSIRTPVIKMLSPIIWGGVDAVKVTNVTQEGLATQIDVEISNIANFDVNESLESNATIDSSFLTGGWSAGIWLKTTSTAYHGLVYFDNGNTRCEWRLQLGKMYMFWYQNNSTYTSFWNIPVPGGYDDGVLRHYAYSVDASLNSTLFIDGVPTSMGQGSLPPYTTNPAKIIIGQDFNGSHDNVGEGLLPFFKKGSISSSDIDKIYNGGQPLCWDVVDEIIDTTDMYRWNAENHTGTAGQELTEKGGSGLDLVKVGALAFNGLASIACEA